jgi:YD repeat-containing protein
METEYGPCACSPLGKVSRVSRPYAPGATPVWTSYQYDSRGRTTRVTLPDGSVTVYEYTGNTVKVTDPAGKWKKQVTDALGNLVQVLEPDPATGADLPTNYTYDMFDRLVQVSMPRGGVTQIRTWTYDPTTLRLASKTEPETGTTTYTWNTDGTLQAKTDARSKVEFTYDSLRRLTKKTPTLVTTLEAGNVVSYYYDSYTPAGTFVQNGAGRLVAVKTGMDTAPSSSLKLDTYEEWYSYTAAGQVTDKRFRFNHDRNTLGTNYVDTTMSFTYDDEGHVTNDNGVAITYDTMGRPKTGLGTTGVTYGPADEVLLIGVWGELNNVVEQRMYNSLGQLTVQKGVGSPT